MGEMIGKVYLDTTYYPGKDLYSDGAIEDEMLAIARDYTPQEFNNVIREKESWPILYHFSHIRENILGWLPLDVYKRQMLAGAAVIFLGIYLVISRKSENEGGEMHE